MTLTSDSVTVTRSYIYTVVDAYHGPSEVTSIPFKLQYISVIHQVQFGSGVGQFLCAYFDMFQVRINMFMT